MAIELEVAGNGTWSGTRAELINYSVDEESTPLTGADTSGATGQLTFDVVSNDDTILLMGDDVTLRDDVNGTLVGKVSAFSDTDGIAGITADSLLVRLTATKTLAPSWTTVGQVITRAFNACGITNGYSIASTIVSRPCTVQGWTGPVWEYLKYLCVVEQIEIALVNGIIQVRTPRSRVVGLDRDSSRTLAVAVGNQAQKVEVIQYNSQFKSYQPVYPKDGVWTEELEVYQVDAGQVIEVEIPVDVSLTYLEQPICVASVPRDWAGTSRYTVAGSDGLPVVPQQWYAEGGEVTLEIGEDQKTIKMTIRGSANTKYSPYTLSMNSGPSDTYSTLRIRGSGVHYTPETKEYLTGLTADETAQEVGITIDNPFVNTAADAATVGVSAACMYSSPLPTLSAQTTTVNRYGESGTQTFGNITGSTVRYRDNWYRLRSAAIGPESTQWSAESDTTYGDHQSAYGTVPTFAQHDTNFPNMTFAEHATLPLKGT